MTTLALSLDLNTVKSVGLIVVGVLVLLAILFAVLIKKIIGKIIALVIFVGLAVAIYVERDNLQKCTTECACTFYGIEIEIPDADLAQQCKDAVALIAPR